MEIPINVDVYCMGELCGRSICLIINPVKEQITHLVVSEKEFPHIQRLVPVQLIVDHEPPPVMGAIQLHCTRAEFSGMKPFEETEFIQSGKLITTYPYEAPYAVWPYGMFMSAPITLEHERIPAGEVAIRRGTPVIATDGRVGKVDEFIVDPKTDAITHLVLREGHLWDQMEVTIPVSKIGRMDADGVYLQLNKKEIEKLPAVGIKRNWK
jgi:sporulation protein YlmC with PRC-barrel domain